MNPDIILPVSRCEENLKCIQEILDKESSVDVPVMLIERLNELQGVMGMSAHIMGSMEYHLENQKKQVINAGASVKLSPSIFKEYVNAECAYNASLYKLAERQCAALVHASEVIRTIVSYQKQELLIANQGGGK